MAAKLNATWPNFKADLLIRRVFRHAEHSNAVISQLKDAGWIPPKQN
jgi:hypothetical protein